MNVKTDHAPSSAGKKEKTRRSSKVVPKGMQSTTKLQKAIPKGAQHKFFCSKVVPKGMQSLQQKVNADSAEI